MIFLLSLLEEINCDEEGKYNICSGISVTVKKKRKVFV